MPVASLLAQQLGGLRVKRTQGARTLTPAPTPSAPVVEVAPVAPAPAQVATRDVLLAAQTVKTIAVSDKDANKVLTFTLTDGSVETVVVESTADIEAKVEALAAKIDDLKKQAVSVATRLEAIEKVI
jgi:hypothetical protein